MKVLVTGAGSGIGQAVADVLHARGDELVLLARNDQRVADLRHRYDGADVRVADLAEFAELAAVVSDVDRLDALVHAAGVIELAAVAELRLEDLTAQLRVNLVAPTELTRALLPALRAARGQVVFLNSSAGLVANAEWGAYAASKFGLRAIADSLRAEEAEAGVRVTSVYLGRVVDADAGQGPRAGGQAVRRRRLGQSRVGRRHDRAPARPAARLDRPRDQVPPG